MRKGLDRTIQEPNELLDSRYFVYDAACNLTSRTDRLGRVIEYNRLLSDGTFNYLYDDEGNRIKKTSISSGDYTEYVGPA